MTSAITLEQWEQRARTLALTGQAFINGQFVDAADGRTFAAISPIDGRVLAQVASCDGADVDRAVNAARQAFDSGVWADLAPRQRKAHLLKLAALIEQNKEELALIESLDMGKPVGDALAFDVPETARCYAWYAEAIDKLYDEIAPTGPDALATITRAPLGVVGCVVPWNFPLMMAAWKLAPAMAVGNSVVLKPAEQSSLSALRLAQLVKEAGIPDGVFNVVPGVGAAAGQALGLHPDVDCIAFTGSTATGKRFMQYAAESNLKRVWLECGGKSPHIVFDDYADLDRAAQAIAAAIFVNQGEVCIAGSRLYVQRSVYAQLMPKVLACAKAMQPMHPLSPGAPMGAIVDERQMQSILARIERGVQEGAQLLMGGQRAAVQEGGFYVEPTVLLCPDAHNSLLREEVFGPVLAVQVFDTEAQALQMANDSIYGLGAGLWTQSMSRAHRVSRKLRAGLVWVNCYADGDISVPFGGVKQSGFGRDKSLHALDKYCDLKTTWINLANS